MLFLLGTKVAFYKTKEYRKGDENLKKIRIGGGAGYGGDRIEPAKELVCFGNLDYIIFECLAERTIALAQQKKQEDGSKGYNELLEYRMSEILPLLREHKVKIITNMGAANPEAAIEVTGKIAEECGLENLKIAAVLGDDIVDNVDRYVDCTILETGRTLKEISGDIVSANAYIGAEGIVKALKQGADIVISGRVADPALTLAPAVYEFGWSMDDYEKLGKATVMGHLLECGAQVCGGYFADPPYKEVSKPWDIGFPIGEITENGDITISKLESSGGRVCRETVTEQLIYEIHDPETYYTPDVVADFSNIEVEEKDGSVIVRGAAGREKNHKYKVSVAYKDGFIGEGEMSYAGSGADTRARLALEIVKKWMEPWQDKIEEEKYDIIGINSLHGDIAAINGRPPAECRIRAAIRTKDRETAEMVGKQVEALYTNGPAGGGGARKAVREVTAIASIFVPENDIALETVIWEGEKK